MKSLTNVLVALSNALGETIQRVTSESSHFVRVAGFASVPDEVLARVFEISCFDTTSPSLSKTHDRAMELACVCRRFRRIALHLPRLWELVHVNCHDDDCVQKLKERCPNPIVSITHDNGKNRSRVPNLLKRLHPTNQWKGLVLDSEGDDVHKLVSLISETSGGDFRRAETLSLTLDNGIEAGWNGLPSTNLLECNAALLSAWTLPSLRHLKINRFIPPPVNCPNLQTCVINLDTKISDLFAWDLVAFKDFLRSIRSVEALSFWIKYACTPADYSYADSDPVDFPHLSSLAITVGYQTESSFVRQIMEFLDTATLSELKVEMMCYETGGGDVDDDNDNRDAWLSEIFAKDSSPRQLQMLANITTFELTTPPGGRRIRYDALLRVVPRVRQLHLKTPFFWSNLSDILTNYKDLQAIFIENSLRNEYEWDIGGFREDARCHSNKLGSLDDFEINSTVVSRPRGAQETRARDFIQWDFKFCDEVTSHEDYKIIGNARLDRRADCRDFLEKRLAKAESTIKVEESHMAENKD